MTAKSFIALVIATLVVGGGFGATFAGGVAVGQNRAEAFAEPAMQLVAPASSSLDSSDPDDATAAQWLQLRQRIQSGEQPTAEELQLLTERFQWLGGTGGFGGFGIGGFGSPRTGAFGRDSFNPGLTGTVEGLAGNVVTVNTSQGTLRAVISVQTVIQRLASIDVADLSTGSQVTVIGARNEEGTFEAATIFVVPDDGLGTLFGDARGGFDRGGRFSGAQTDGTND